MKLEKGIKKYFSEWMFPFILILGKKIRNKIREFIFLLLGLRSRSSGLRPLTCGSLPRVDSPSLPK